MKNIFIVLVSFFALGSTYGQFFENVQAGARANGNVSKIKNIHGESKSKIGFGAGAVFVKPLDDRYEYNIQLEILFNQYGEKDEDVKKSEDISLNYITFPVLFKAFFSNMDNEFFGLIGPQFGYLVGKSKFPKESYKPFDMGLTMGLGYSLNREIEADGRIYYGFTDSSDFKGDNNNFVLSLGLSYFF